MHPYRTAPIGSAANAAPLAHDARAAEVDLVGALLLAAGGVVTLAGMISTDGTEFAIGTLMVMSAVRRAAATILTPRAKRSALLH